jgi:hypothetical protein
MAKHWYMYANNKFIAESAGCTVCLNQCPAIQYVSDMIAKVIYEPLVNREFNIKAESVCDPDALKQHVLKVCAACQQKSK